MCACACACACVVACAYGDLLGPLIFLDGLGELGQRGGQIGREGPVDVGLELVEVDLDHLVVVAALVGAQVAADFLGRRDGVGNVLAAGRGQVGQHRLRQREDRRRGTHLRTHVTDRSHSYDHTMASVKPHTHMCHRTHVSHVHHRTRARKVDAG